MSPLVRLTHFPLSSIPPKPIILQNLQRRGFGDISSEPSSLGRFALLGLSESIPVGKVKAVSVHATLEYTYAVVGRETLWCTTSLDICGDYTTLANMSFAAPSQLVGSASFRGTLTNVTLRLGI